MEKLFNPENVRLENNAYFVAINKQYEDTRNINNNNANT
jgi:hypothetical protein